CQSQLGPDGVGESVGDRGRHIGLAYARCSSNPSALVDFRSRDIQMFKAAENLVLIVLDPECVDLFCGSYATLIECPLSLFCTPNSNGDCLHYATPLQAIARC